MPRYDAAPIYEMGGSSRPIVYIPQKQHTIEEDIQLTLRMFIGRPATEQLYAEMCAEITNVLKAYGYNGVNVQITSHDGHVDLSIRDRNGLTLNIYNAEDTDSLHIFNPQEAHEAELAQQWNEPLSLQDIQYNITREPMNEMFVIEKSADTGSQTEYTTQVVETEYIARVNRIEID